MRGWWVLLCVAGCAKHLPPTIQPDEVLAYRTDDGWLSEVRHYPGDGPPVLMVHGMGANHYNWDFRPEVSLSDHLQGLGWDVWVVELRGDPGSLAPSRRAARRITFEDHALRDLPAAVDAVLAHTGEDQLFWVGHSMGGMLLYTALGLYPDKIAAGVAICSPGTFEEGLPVYPLLRAFGGLVGRRGSVAARQMARASAPLGRANPLFGRLANRRNLDWPVANGLARHALVDLPRGAIHEARTWLRTRDFVRVDGQPWVRPTQTPLLVLGAPLDRVVSERDVAATCAMYPGCSYRRLGVADGFSVDYGHIDPVVGKTAPTEIYPIVAEFLDAQRLRPEAAEAP